MFSPRYTDKKSFRDVRDAYIRLVACRKNHELARFKLGKSASRPGLIFLKMSRVGSKMWKIEPLGWGTYDRRAQYHAYCMQGWPQWHVK